MAASGGSALVNEEKSGWELPSGREAPGRLRGNCVGHCVEIDAPPELVWDFIVDFEGWQAWNPLYVSTRGKAEPGRKLHFSVRLDGLRPQKGVAQVTAVRPNEFLEYGMSSFGGLLKVQRFVEVAELSPTRCTVTNGEIMGGPIGALISRAAGDKVGNGLQGMNEALKAVAERKSKGRPR